MAVAVCDAHFTILLWPLGFVSAVAGIFSTVLPAWFSTMEGRLPLGKREYVTVFPVPLKTNSIAASAVISLLSPFTIIWRQGPLIVITSALPLTRTLLNFEQAAGLVWLSPLIEILSPSEFTSTFTMSAGSIGVSTGVGEIGGVGVPENFSISFFAVSLRRSHDAKVAIDRRQINVSMIFIMI